MSPLSLEVCKARLDDPHHRRVRSVTTAYGLGLHDRRVYISSGACAVGSPPAWLEARSAPVNPHVSVQLRLTHSPGFLLLCAGPSLGQVPTHQPLLLLLFAPHSNRGRLVRNMLIPHSIDGNLRQVWTTRAFPGHRSSRVRNHPY